MAIFPICAHLSPTVLVTTLLDVGRGLVRIAELTYCPRSPAAPFHVVLLEGTGSVRKSDSGKGVDKPAKQG